MNHLVASFLFSILLFSVESKGQTHIADSLILQLPAAKEDTNKVNLLCEISYFLYNAAPKKSIEYCEQAINLSEELGYERGLVNALYKRSLAKSTLGEYDEAIEDANDALERSEKNGFNKRVRSCLNVIGIYHRYKGDTEKAIDYTLRALEISKELKDSLHMGYAYNNIGSVYIDRKDTLGAIKYYREALDLYEQLKQEREIVETVVNLGSFERDTSLRWQYIEKSLEMGYQQDYHHALVFAHANRGNFIWHVRKQPELALEDYQKALAFAKGVNNYFLLTNMHLETGVLFEELDQPDSAFYHYSTGLNMAEGQEMKEQMLKAHAFMADYYAGHGRYEQAYSSMLARQDLADSSYTQKIANALAEADTRYETSKKEAQIAAQELELARQKNRQNQLVIGGLVLLALTAGVFQYFFYRQKRKKKEVELALQNELAEAERLRQMDEMKTQFFTNVSHELRTPLSLIISPLEEVKKRLKQVDLEADLDLAHRNSRQLLGLVNEVLDLSKLEAGKLEVSKTEVELLPLLRRVFFSFQSAADIKNVKLDFQSDLSENLMLKTDVPKLEKILNNLISNALKFSPTGSHISMKSDLTNFENLPNLTLSITDHGPGIHSDDLPHIFDRFFQSKKGGRAEGGTGIGLALAKQFSKLLGGDLTVKSTLGKGSTFTLSHPADFSKFQPAAKTETVPNPTTDILPEAKEKRGFEPIFINGQKPHILIVEDNPEMSEYLKKSLSKNYVCTIAADGDAALKYLNDCGLETLDYRLPDLITSDVMMPNMDGFTLREKINERDEWRKIPFILLTARTLEEDKLKGFQLGIDDYVTKPFSLPELEARIHNLLENKQLREEESDFDEAENISPNEQLVRDAENLVLKKLDDTQFTVEMMAKELGFSQRQLARIFTKQTGLTPVKFILEIRLQKARQLLEKRQFATVSEVRYEVGIESASYFTRKFTERFGKNPKEYLEVV